MQQTQLIFVDDEHVPVVTLGKFFVSPSRCTTDWFHCRSLVDDLFVINGTLLH